MAAAGKRGRFAYLLAIAPVALLSLPAMARADENSIGEADELRIIELRLRDRSTLARDLFAWQVGDDLFLPAEETFAALGFPIEVSGEGVASGWFLRERQRFVLDPIRQIVTVAGREYVLTEREFRMIDKVPHVSVGALNRWFSIGAQFVTDRQVVAFEPPYLLPDEETARRSGGRNPADSNGGTIDTTGFATVRSPYRALGWPHLTANLAISHDGSARDELAASAQILAVGDMLFMTGQLAVSYSTQGVSTARVTLGRRDADAGLLGPLSATYFEFGDVTSDSLPLISRNSAGLGLRFGKEPFTRADSFDTTDIIGDAPPGWQAELFREGEVLAFQEIGNDGRFVFPDVPLRFGSNRFRVQLYGPSGERDVIDRTFEIADNLIEPGGVRYSVAVFDSSASLFGSVNLEEFRFDEEGQALSEGLYAEASAGVGLSGSLSLSGFAAMRDRNDRGLRGWYGASGTWRGGRALVSGDLAMQDDGALAWRAGLLTGLGAFSLALSREQFSRGFESEESQEGSSGGIASRSEATLDARLPTIGLALSLGEVRQFDGTRDRSAQFRLSGQLLGLAMTHRLAWRELERPDIARENRIDGSLAASGALGELRLRAAADYEIRPQWRIQRLRGEANYRLANWYLLAGIDHELEDDGSQWRLGASRDWNGVRLGVEGRYDDRRDDVRVLATLALALDRGGAGDVRLGRAARSDRGQLLPRGFHDLDGDAEFDEGEPAMELRFITDPRGRSFAGQGVIDDLPLDRLITVVPDLASNPDPFLVPLRPGYRVMGRPGAVQRIDVPLVDSADAELVLRDASGRVLAGAVVELQPCSGGPIARERTAHDGLAYFRQLLPGCYRVTRPAGFDATLNLVAKDVLRRDIAAAGEDTGS